MSQDKFTRRSSRNADSGGAPQYDFSAVAEDAVSRARAQGGDDSFGAPDTGSARPARRPRGKPPQSSDPWDSPVSRDEAMGEKAPKRSPFARRQTDELDRSFDRPAEPADEPSSQKRRTPGFVKLLPQSVTGRDRFDRQTGDDFSAGSDTPPRRTDRFSRKRPNTDVSEAAWDKPVSRDDVAAEDKGAPRRISGLLGRKGAQKDQQPEAEERPLRGRSGREEDFSRRGSEMASPGLSNTPDLFDDDFSDDLSDDFDTGTVFSPGASAPADVPKPAQEPQEPRRRLFNAATQPNYSYMTDEEPALQEEEAHDASSFTSGLASIKASIMHKLNREEPDDTDYYTPPANRAPSEIRRHQKRRNRRPWPMWMKATLFGLCLAVAFFSILYAAFYIIITGRIDYVGDSTRNTVYLSVAEKANHEADLTDTEENAAEFTEPLTIAEPNGDVKVIMVVASDSQIGSNGGITAKTDAIMLMALDHENKRIRIASLMTDTYVRIQDYQSNKLSKAYYYDTVNGDYSLSRLKQAIRDNFGVVPDNFIVVDFDALQIIVERLGGVNVYVSADEAYYMSSHERYGDFPRFNSEGPYTMSGSEALNYVRMRAVGNGDYDRVARQRKVFSQILVKLQGKSKLELAEFAYSVLPELPTDISAGDMFGYLTDATDIASYEITEVTFPITNSWRYGTATVRDEAEHVFVTDSVTSSSDLSGTVSDGDVVSGSDITPTPAPTTDNKFTVIVTNFQFNATALQRYLYDNDESYLNGAAANGVTVPEIIAPLESDSPAAAA